MTGGAESADLAALVVKLRKQAAGRDPCDAAQEALDALEALAAEVAGLQDQLADVQCLSLEWMRKHDALLGFIQERPPILKELIEEAALSSPSSKRWRAERRLLNAAVAWYQTPADTTRSYRTADEIAQADTELTAAVECYLEQNCE